MQFIIDYNFRLGSFLDVLDVCTFIHPIIIAVY